MFMRLGPIIFSLVLAAAMPAYSAAPIDTSQPQAPAPLDCEDPGKAATYAADFDMRMKNAVDTMKARELASQQAYETRKRQIVVAGIWNEQSANAFMLQFASSDRATLGFQSKRDAAAKEAKSLMYATAGLPVVAGNDKAAERRGLCLLGQKAINQLAIVSDASAAAWSRVNGRVAEFGKEKGVQGL